MAGPDTNVDVVVPLFRPGPWLRVSLDSIRAQRKVYSRVWLIDDDPTSDIGAAIAAEWPDFTYIKSSQNFGFARACNRGLAFGSAPFVLVVNQDTRLEPDYTAHATRALLEDPSLGAVGGLLLRQNDAESPPDGTIDTAGIAFRRGRRAVDVGQGQLAWKLRQDPRVVVMEKTNARFLAPARFPKPFQPVDLVVIDCSFISLRKILPPALAFLRPIGRIVALVKPQFEAGKAEADRGCGVITDPQIHRRVLAELQQFVRQQPALAWLGVTESPLLGPAGNKEFLILLEKGT